MNLDVAQVNEMDAFHAAKFADNVGNVILPVRAEGTGANSKAVAFTIMGPLSRPRSKILRVAVSRIILSSEASKVKLVGNLVA